MRRLFARLRPPADTSDRQLLDRFRAARDEAAFAELVRRHGPLVWGVCRRSLPVADAEDAFQATFLLLLRRPGFTPAGSVAPWLYRAAVLTARTARRADRRRRLRVRVGLPAVEPAAHAPDLDLRDAVDVALLSLPARDRAAVLLCHVQGHTRAEAARLLGVPEGTLSARLSRALARLRTRLGGHEPAAVLAVAGAGLVPPGLAAAAGRAGVIYLAGGAVPPAVAALTHGVTHMGWVKTLTAAGLVLVAAAGTGIGVGLRAEPPSETPAGKPAAAKPAPDPLAEAERKLAAFADQLSRLDAVRVKTQADLAAAESEVFALRAALSGRPTNELVLTDAGSAGFGGSPRFRLTEPTDGGPLRFGADTPAAATTLLARTRAARPGLSLSLDAAAGVTAERLAELFRAVRAAGYERVHYAGPDRFDAKNLAAGPGRRYQEWPFPNGTLRFVGAGGQRPPADFKPGPAAQDMYAGPLDLTKLK